MVDERVEYWLPVDQYIGGIEHAILHLLYSRFWTKVMRDLGLVKFDEPFAQPAHAGHGAERDLLPQERTAGASPTTTRPRSRRDGEDGNARVLKSDGQPVESGGIGTMSKSKNNGVDPQELIDHYGADIARFFMMFASPPGRHAGVERRGRRRRGALPAAAVDVRRGNSSEAGVAASGRSAIRRCRRNSPACGAKCMRC